MGGAIYLSGTSLFYLSYGIFVTLSNRQSKRSVNYRFLIYSKSHDV